MCQIVFFRNKNIFYNHNSILDLVFSNTCFLVENSLEPIVSIDSYRLPLNIILPYSGPKPPCDNQHTFYNLCKSNYSNISFFINGFDWNYTLASLDIKVVFNAFFDVLHLSNLKFVPKGQFLSSTYPPRFTRKLKDIL